MPSVISVQSHVCYGHVGNSAAVFPLQSLGIEVHSIPTTILSNHPAHPSCFGHKVEASLLRDLFRGIEDRGALNNSAGFLSGYLASQENGEVIEETVRHYKDLNPQGLYCLDPVMGDKGPGFFVSDGIPKLIMEQLLPLADIITPNKFEFDQITQTNTQSFGEMAEIARDLMREHTLKCVVITSAEETKGIQDSVIKGKRKIGVLIVRPDKSWHVSTPFLEFSPSGAGDLFTSLFIGWVLRGVSEEVAAQKSISTVYQVIELTKLNGKTELDIITHQKCINDYVKLFPLITV